MTAETSTERHDEADREGAHAASVAAWQLATDLSDHLAAAIGDARSLLGRTDHPAHLTSARQVRDALQHLADLAKISATVVAFSRQTALNATATLDAADAERLATASLELARQHAERAAAYVVTSPARLPVPEPHGHAGADPTDYRPALRGLDIALKALASDYLEVAVVVSEQASVRPLRDLAGTTGENIWAAFEQLAQIAQSIQMASVAMYREKHAAHHVRRDLPDVIAAWVANPIEPSRLRFKRHLAAAVD